MKLGIMFSNSGPFADPELSTHLAQSAERVGFESLWAVEHVVVPQDYASAYPYSKSGKMPGGGDLPIPDPFISLTWMAAHTTRIKLATGIVILPQRHPLYVAKEAATLDVLSRGRFILGVGSGWLKEEFDALGIDFHRRGARTDEAIVALRAVWGGAPASFHGKHFSFGPLFSSPRPVQPAGVPIHIGGHSPAAARRAGRLGDGFFPARAEPEALRDLFRMASEEAVRAGRDPAKIELSCMGRASLDTVKQCQDVGVARLVIAPPAYDREGLTRALDKIGDEVLSRL
jgi:probable F420-dependent oxidoreductase